MLILSRRKDEAVVINTDITVTIVEVMADDRVRLGIAAPKETSVHRKEVFEAIHQAPPPHSLLIERLDDVGSTGVSLSPRQLDYVQGLCRDLAKNSWGSVDRDRVIQTILDAVQEMNVDLSKAESLEEMKKLLVDAARGD